MKLYIDPGTGAMLFSLATGLISVVWFGARKLYMRAKYRTTGKVDKNKKDIVIYGEDKRYWTTFKGILDEFEKRKVKVSYLAGSEDDPLLNEGYEYVETEVIGLGNKAYAKLNFLNARIVLATTPGLDVYQWKRSRTVDWYVHITHTIGGGTAYRMFGTQFYDAVLMSSESFIHINKELEEKRNSPSKDIVAVGCTYMDYLLSRKDKAPQKSKPRETDRVAVLVAPTWGSSSILNQYGEMFINHLIETGFDITIRPHPQSFISDYDLIKCLMDKYPESEFFHWNQDADNFNILNQSDILISDFSGTIYDFSFVFERPVLYTDLSIDMSQKDEAWLDEPYFGRVLIPRIGKELKEKDFNNLKQVITELLSDETFHQSILAARDEYWQGRGDAASLVTDYLLEKLEVLKE